jgi:hypothetical protein
MLLQIKVMYFNREKLGILNLSHKNEALVNNFDQLSFGQSVFFPFSNTKIILTNLSSP